MKTVLSFSSCGTDIPYFDPQEFKPEERHEYVDLRANPNGVDELPELKDAPLFRDYLLKINGADTIFRTFGCNFYLSPVEEVVIGPAIPPSDQPQTQTQLAIANSYVHVGFADLARCARLDDYYRLAGRLAKHLHERPDFAELDDIENHILEISVETLRMNSEEKGFILALTCDTIGETDGESKVRWATLMGVISTFLANENLE
jgi:hypothetical protein